MPIHLSMIQWDTLIDISSAVCIPRGDTITIQRPTDHRYLQHPSSGSRTRQYPRKIEELAVMTSQRWIGRLAVLVVCLLDISPVSALSATLCSDMNTAGGNGNYSIYQSNGLCYDFCPTSAFSILQGPNCWCSNVAPGDTTSLSDCNSPCVGYPDDLCGNADSGLWGYFKIPGNKPTSTAGGSNHQTGSTPPVAETTDSNTIFITVFPTASSESSTKTTDPATPGSNGDSTSDMTWTPTPVISLETVTGQVRTVTVTPTIPPNSQNVGEVTSKGKGAGGLGTAGAVGLTIGLVALIAIICAIVYFCWRRRQKEREVLAYNDVASRGGSSAGLGGPIPSRTMSENSRYVLNTDGRQVIESYEGDLPGSRRSRLMPVDPRLNPHAPLYQRGGENKSRESVNTIRDDHDYSRPVHQQGPILRATNPDQ